MKIILGSKSVGRKQILKHAGYEFETMSADIDEKAIRSDDFKTLPLLLAKEKAKVLLKKIKKPAILITGDQVAIYNGMLREKPESKQQARQYLQNSHKYPVQINTAVVVTNTKSGKQAEALDITKAFFKKIPQEIVEEL